MKTQDIIIYSTVTLVAAVIIVTIMCHCRCRRSKRRQDVAVAVASATPLPARETPYTVPGPAHPNLGPYPTNIRTPYTQPNLNYGTPVVQSNIGPPNKYMGPLNQHMEPPKEHIRPPSQQHMGPPNQYMGPPKQHTEPSKEHIRPPPGQQHMGPLNQHMGPPNQHMEPPYQHMCQNNEHIGSTYFGPPNSYAVGVSNPYPGLHYLNLGPSRDDMGSPNAQMGASHGRDGPSTAHYNSTSNGSSSSSDPHIFTGVSNPHVFDGKLFEVSMSAHREVTAPLPSPPPYTERAAPGQAYTQQPYNYR